MKKLDEPILAEGEATGHAHRLVGDVDVYETDEDTKVFSLPGETTVKHEEHKAINLPAGEWESGIVEEYDHMAEEARRVAD